eukprot:363265-Chlamydomonas_euryale.AAC.3
MPRFACGTRPTSIVLPAFLPILLATSRHPQPARQDLFRVARCNGPPVGPLPPQLRARAWRRVAQQRGVGDDVLRGLEHSSDRTRKWGAAAVGSGHRHVDAAGTARQHGVLRRHGDGAAQ